MGKETRVVVVSGALRLFGRLKGDKKGEREKGKITHTSPVLHDRSFSLSLEHILTDNNKSFGIHWDKIVKKKKLFFFFLVFLSLLVVTKRQKITMFFYCTEVLYQQLYQFIF